MDLIRSGNASRLEVARRAFGGRVAVSEPFPDRPPLWIEPLDDGLRSDIAQASAWIGEHREAIEAALLSFGGILWRGLPVDGTDAFAALMDGWTPFSKGYTGGTSDRKAIKGAVMESTRTPTDYYILLHQEMAYLPHNPRLVAFYCRTPSPVGGHTVICDMRGLLEALPIHLRERFLEEGVRYGRNLRDDAAPDWRADPAYGHATWQYWFDSDDRDAVSARLSDRQIPHRWEADRSLSFWTERPAVIDHPATGERLLFNQLYAQQQHPVCITQARADLMDQAYGNHTPRPYSTAFGSGAPLTDEDFSLVHAEMERRRVDFDWREGDVILLENKLTGHGRTPYHGSREVQVMLLE